MTDTERALREANPIPDSDERWAAGTLDERALVELAGLRADRGPSRRGVLVAAAVVTVAAGTGAVAIGLPFGASPAQAATPALLPLTQASSSSASAALLAIAERARTSGAAPLTTSREVSYAGWYLNTSVTDARATSAVCPQQIDQSDNGDGTLTLRTRRLAGCDPDTGALNATAAPVGTATDEQVIPANQTPAPPTDPTHLPTYLDSLAGARTDTAGLFRAVRDLAITWSLDPALRCGVLTVLANAPGITAAGETTDRFQRVGQAFTVDSDISGLPTRYVLVLDPASGNLLGYEAWLTEDAGKLNVSIPAVTEYEAWRY